ncbi:MAG: cupin domain-containing protein [Emcibacter sp.]|nr:cupin domain-containing protein [Emcibacter sp.]
MNIYPSDITSDDVEITELFKIIGLKEKPADLVVGIAGFPEGLRHPPEGMSVHEQDEISIILDGGFFIETIEGKHECKTGDVIHIPAGEAHASTAFGYGKVFYVLFG